MLNGRFSARGKTKIVQKTHSGMQMKEDLLIRENFEGSSGHLYKVMVDYIMLHKV